MLLIFPPIAKPSEPPAGIARLSGALRANGVPCHMLDANIEGLLYLLGQPPTVADTWTRRAAKNVSGHVAALREMQTYRSADRYGRAVRDLNRLIAAVAENYGVVAGLSDYQHLQLSPLRSADLLQAAAHPELNPFYPYFEKRLPQLVEEESDNCVGISLNYLSQALCTFAIIGFLRKRFPSLNIVLGGGLVTSWTSRPGWSNPFGGLVDHVISGPGELPLLALHDVPMKKLQHVPPDYEVLPLHQYLSPGFILPYSAASGCYWNQCSFCPERAEGNKYQPVPQETALADISLLKERTKPALLHLLDNAITPALLQALAKNPPGVPWYGFARIDKLLADIDFCMALKRSGCVMLKLGLESGDQEVLDAQHKGIEITMASQVLSNLKKAGIATYVYLLFGTPAESEPAARRTLEFVLRHSDAIGFLNLALFNMPINGEEAMEYATAPFYEGDLSLYTAFRHPAGWNRGEVRLFLKEFKRHPAIATIIRNDPPFFTSNHAPFFCL